MIISILRWYSAVCFHTSVGFLLVYLIWWAMRRPLLVNKQRRSALFLYTHPACAFLYQLLRKDLYICKKCITFAENLDYD